MTTDLEFRAGRLKPHPDIAGHRRLKLRHFLVPGLLPSILPVADWVSLVDEWPMYGNDNWGDCVFAMIGHSIEAATRYGQGTTVELADQIILDAYSAVTGFDPNAGDPGSNPTDQGTVIQDALNYWRKEGIGGHKILGFAQVDHENPDEVRQAVRLFGHLQLGINFPNTAMDQFNAGEPWDVVKGARDEGGHAINLGYYTDQSGKLRWKPVTWAKLQEMTDGFFKKYVEEAWVVITPEWLDAAGNNPEGINLSALGEAFTQLTGDPSPFPVNPPAPAPPGPQPPPAPVGVDPHDRALLAAQDEWRSAKGLQ